MNMESDSQLHCTLLDEPDEVGSSPTFPVITNFQPSMDGVKRNMMNTEDTLRPIHAYTSVSMCANLTILLLHFPTVAPFAPVIGLGAGLGFAYLFSKGLR